MIWLDVYESRHNTPQEKYPRLISTLNIIVVYKKHITHLLFIYNNYSIYYLFPNCFSTEVKGT